jgi:hypothetical protein
MVVDSTRGAVEESAGRNRWFLWVANLAIVVIALFALFGGAI